MIGINRSIFRRLVLSHLLIILVGLMTVGLATAWFVKGFIYETRQEQLVRSARQINHALVDTPMDEALPLPELLAFLDQSFDARLWLFDSSGKIVATSAESDVYVGKDVAPPVVSKVMAGQDIVEDLKFQGLPEPMLSVVVPWGKGEQIEGGLILHAPVDGLNQTIARVRETILWASLIAMTISATAGSYLSWTISRPLKEMELVATDLGHGRYEKRVQIDSPDEIGDLAAAINSMAAELSAIEMERQNLARAREDLFANISHELRSPLTAILGFLEALQDGFAENQEQQQLYLAVTYREALHLRRLVEDLLDLTRLTARRVAIHRVAVNAAEAVREVADQLLPVARARGNQLVVEPPPAGLPPILADPVRLKQILTNLAENAIKFTDAGRITLGVARDGEDVLIRVADTGIGIDESDLPLIWERFYKADRLRTRSRGGTGLGLAIVKELVALHGGRIEVESRVGQGTVFTVRLPAYKTA